MTDLQPGADPRSCFGSVADAYDRGRPSYPTQAAAWLVGEQPATVLELGAGTGKLTEVLVGLGHEVHATDPDAAMLERLRARMAPHKRWQVDAPRDGSGLCQLRPDTRSTPAPVA